MSASREELIEICDQLMDDYDAAEEALGHAHATIKRQAAELRELRAAKR